MPVKFLLNGKRESESEIETYIQNSTFKISLYFKRHGWLHSIVDEPPTRYNYKKSIADLGHFENETGTQSRYSPFNTTIPKINEYKPHEKGGFKSLGDRINLLKKYK